MEINITTNSPRQTQELGERLGRSLIGGMVVGLIGPLGAGKTMLVKGIAVGNGIVDASIVTSPTFTLVQEYCGWLHLFHLDLYRLHRVAELTSLGFDEMIRPDSVVIVEWADKMPEALPLDVLWIDITPASTESRKFTLRPTGTVSRSLTDRMAAFSVGTTLHD